MIYRQRGISITGLLIALVIFIVLALFAMKVVPSFMEYRTAKAAIEVVATQAQSVNDARRLFNSRAAIDNITLKDTDLEFSREGNQMVVGFAYRKEVPLFRNVGLYIDYAASSKGGQ